MADSAIPASEASSGPERGAGARGRVRVAAVVGALASALWCVSFFLPWIAFPDGDRARFQAALEPSIEAMAHREPKHAERYRILVRQVVDEGHLSGLDLYHYARTAFGLNRTLIGESPGEHVLERPWVVQRALRAAGFVLAALPILSAIVALHFLAHAFRRARVPVLILLVLLGLSGAAVVIAWLQFAEGFATGNLTGRGLHVALVASVAQACAGLFAVTTKTWWKVYVAAIVGMGSLTILAGRYVTLGAFP